MLATTTPTTTRRRPTRRESPKVETLKPSESVGIDLEGEAVDRRLRKSRMGA